MDKTMMNGASRRSINNNKPKKSVTHKRNNLNLIPSFDAHNLLPVSEKSKKEKVRSLSSVSKALSSYQMGCHLSDSHKSPNAISNNKFKLPKKDCNGVVHHASVPRKIRSAMKKRGRESILTDSEKVNRESEIDGIESREKDGIKKKSKKKRSTTTMKQVELGPITKDEEEVAETLYALAGMFPIIDGSEDRIELDCESLPEKSLVLQDHQECANATFEASGTTQDASLISNRSPTGDAKISSLNETSGQEQAERTAPNTNMQPVPVNVRSENGGKVASHDTELCLEMGLNVTAQSQSSHPDMEFEMAGGNDCKLKQHIIKHWKENEWPALWPALSSRGSARMDASELQSSAAKAPNWLNAAINASKQDLKQSFSSGDKLKMQTSEVVIRRKSWKKCAAHVHISHLIRSLEVPNGQVAKEPDRVHHGTDCGVLLETHNLNWMSNRNSSASGIVHSATVRSSHEAKSGTPQQLSRYHDMSQTPAPGVYGPQKQNFNFLSLSVGGNGLKVNDSFNDGRSRLELLSKSQVPYFQSLQQQHGLMPLLTPQSQYASSTSYLDQLPAAGPQVRLQQPHYYGTPLCGTQYSSTASYKQQQQSFWAVQLAANGGSSAVNCNIVRAQYPNWQSGRVESCAVSPFAQVISSISQQKPFPLASSLHPSRTIGLDIHLPSVCEESKGRFRSSGTPSLQLLCDERL